MSNVTQFPQKARPKMRVSGPMDELRDLMAMAGKEGANLDLIDAEAETIMNKLLIDAGYGPHVEIRNALREKMFGGIA